MDVASGFIHGDLNTNNILVKFADDKEFLEGYYLIDFALFKEDMPLLYDQRYLEMSYLMHAMSRISFAPVEFSHAAVRGGYPRSSRGAHRNIRDQRSDRIRPQRICRLGPGE